MIPLRMMSLPVLALLAATLPAAAGPALPDAAAVQAAYDRAAASAEDRHDADVRILGVDCAEAGGTRVTCTVGFAKTDEASDRVYLDSALVERRSGGDWTLLQGLCRRLL